MKKYIVYSKSCDMSQCLPVFEEFCCRFIKFLQKCVTHDSALIRAICIVKHCMVLYCLFFFSSSSFVCVCVCVLSVRFNNKINK